MKRSKLSSSFLYLTKYICKLVNCGSNSIVMSEYTEQTEGADVAYTVVEKGDNCYYYGMFMNNIYK